MLASYRVSFLTSFFAALVNLVFGLLVAWVLVRYEFPGKRLIDSLIDLPFALPTAVAGIALTAIYAPNGWVGKLLEPLGIKVAFTPLGITLALMFIGLPFVVRTVQPVLQDLDNEVEEAAVMLGACRWRTFRKVMLPELIPPLLTGFALAFARGIGEYGSVVFISGNMPMKTEIAPLLIMTKLEQFDYAGRDGHRAGHAGRSRSCCCCSSTTCRWRSSRRVAGAHRRRSTWLASFTAPSVRRRRRVGAAHRRNRAACGWTLIAVALLFLGWSSCCRSLSVFVEAFKKGWSVYIAAIPGPGCLSALRLTLLTAAIAVPLNTRVRRRGGLGDQRSSVSGARTCS